MTQSSIESTKIAKPVLLLEWWKPIKGWEGLYEVSNVGNVRSNKAFKIPTLGKRGYYVVSLWKNNKERHIPVHRVMGESFIGPLPGGWHTNHKNGWKLKNWLSNLEYLTLADNTKHAQALGLIQKGEERPMAKLTEEKVREIRRIGYSQLFEITASQFGVGMTTISNVINRKRWKHVV